MGKHRNRYKSYTQYHKTEPTHEDPLDREIRWFVSIVMIAAFVILVGIPVLGTQAQPLQYLDGIIPLAYADSNIYMLPDYNFPTHTGTGLTCPTITGPSSATDTAPTPADAHVFFADSDLTGGCTFRTYTVGSGAVSPLIPTIFNDFITDISGLLDITEEADTDKAVVCAVNELSSVGAGLDPRLNITAAYEVLRSPTGISTYSACDSSNTQNPQFISLGTIDFLISTTLNDTFYSTGLTQGFDRVATGPEDLQARAFLYNWKVAIPVNFTDNYWLFQEHPNFVGGTITEGFLGIDDFKITLDTGVATSNVGQSFIMKTFNKTDIGTDKHIKFDGEFVGVSGKDDVMVYFEIRDGKYEIGNLADFQPNAFTTYKAGGSLGVIHQEPATADSPTAFGFTLKPNWSNSTDPLVTVFAGIWDNSTSANMIMNITNIEIADNVKYNFTDVADLRFWETDCTTGTDNATDVVDRACENDYDLGMIQLENVTTTSFSAPAPPTPIVPTGLSAVTTGDTTISLTWDHNLFNLTNFRIERETPEGGGFSVIVPNTANITESYNDSGLLAGTQYNYQIFAMNGESISGVSTNSSSTTTGSAGTNPPENSTATTRGYESIFLDWDHDGLQVTNFTISRESPIGGGFSFIANTSDTYLETFTTEFLDTNNNLSLNGSTQYNYKICAVNGPEVETTCDTVAATTTPEATTWNLREHDAGNGGTDMIVGVNPFGSNDGISVQNVASGSRGGFGNVIWKSFNVTDLGIRDSDLITIINTEQTGGIIDAHYISRICNGKLTGFNDTQWSANVIVECDFVSQKSQQTESNTPYISTISIDWNSVDEFVTVIYALNDDWNTAGSRLEIANVTWSNVTVYDFAGLTDGVTMNYTNTNDLGLVPESTFECELNGPRQTLSSQSCDAGGFISINTPATAEFILAETNDDWQYREHNSVEQRGESFSNFNSSSLGFEMFSHSQNQPYDTGELLLFKVFNATDIIDKEISVGWDGELITGASGIDARIKIFNGSLSRWNGTQFESDVRLSTNNPEIVDQFAATIPFSSTITTFTVPTVASTNLVTLVLELDDVTDSLARNNDGVITIQNITINGDFYNFKDATQQAEVGSVSGVNSIPSLLVTDELGRNTDRGLVAPSEFIPTPIPAGVTGLIATSGESGITLTWDASANTTSYRIFRTSTESGDTQVFLNTGLSGTVQVIAEGPRDHISQTRFLSNLLTGEIITDTTFHCLNNAGSATGGIFQGALFVESQTASLDETTLRNSTTKIAVEDISSSGSGIKFNYRGDDLLNFTETLNHGIGVSWINRASGTLNCGSNNSLTGNSEQSRWDVSGSPNWARTNGEDLRVIFNKLNQAKLSSDPFVSDTASTSVTFLDTNVDATGDSNTYFYRVVGLNFDEVGGFSNVADATAFVSPNPPTAVIAVQNPTNITVTWTKNVSAEGYNVYRYGANDTDFAGQRNFLPADYLRSNAENRYTPALDVLNTDVSVSISSTVHSDAINFTQSGNATLTAIQIGLFTTGGCSGTNSWIPTVWNGTTDLSGANAQLVNGTEIPDCSIVSDQIWFFDDFELVDGDNYLIGIQRNGSSGQTLFENRRILGGGVPYGSDSLGTWEVGQVDKNVFNSTGFGNSGHDKVISVFAEQHKKVATLGDVDTFVDTNLLEGITYFYKIRSTISGEEGIDSDDVNATATIPVGGDIINSTSAIWQMREHREPTSFIGIPNMDFKITDSTSGSPLDILTFDTGADIISTGNDIGSAQIFKVFPKADIEGSDITVFWEKLVVSGTLVDVATLSVINGTVHKDSIIDWSDGNLPHTDKETLASVSSSGATFVMTSETIPASSIDYENATDFITVKIEIDDSRGIGTKELRIANVTISQVGVWDFTGMTGDMIIFTELHDPPQQGIASFGRCYVACQGPEGYHSNRGFINFTASAFSEPPTPDPVTGLSLTVLESGISLEWNAAANATDYQIFRTSTESADEVKIFDTTITGVDTRGLTELDDNFDGICEHFDFDSSTNIFKDEMLSRLRTQISRTGTADGTVSAGIWNDCNGPASTATLADSTTMIDASTISTSLVTTDFNFRGLDLLNKTSGFTTFQYGSGVQLIDSTTGTINVLTNANLDTGGSKGAIGQWNGGTNNWDGNTILDIRGEWYVVNRTKLSNDPFVTSQVPTTLLDTSVTADADGGHTYFYRVVGLNFAQEQGGFSSTENATAFAGIAEPTNVSAVQNGTDITINWTKEASADGYKILRKATNDTTSKVRGQDLPDDYLKITDSPVADVELGGINTQANVAINAFTCGNVGSIEFCARGQNFTMGVQDATLNKARLHITAGQWTSGTGLLKLAVWNGSSASSNEFLANATTTYNHTDSFGDFPEFEFEDGFVLQGNKTYIVGPYVNGTINTQILMFRDLTGFGFTNYAADFTNGQLVHKQTAIANWIAVASVNLQMELYVDQFEEIATLGDVDTFTDVLTPFDEGHLFFYKVQSLIGAVAGNSSAPVNQTAPLIAGSELFNDTSTVWQFREHDRNEATQPTASGAGCSNSCGSGGHFPNSNVTIGPQEGRVISGTENLLNLNTGLTVTGGDASGDDRSHGSLHLFKIFNATEISGSDIIIGWQQEGHGSASLDSIPRVEVYDGIINKDSGFNFAVNVPARSNTEGVRTTLIGSAILGIDNPDDSGDFPMEIRTLSATDIGWGNVTSDFVTVLITVNDDDAEESGGSNSGSYSLFIANLTISNVGRWDFNQSQIIYTGNGNRQGAGDVCPRDCMDAQNGFIGDRGFVNATVAFVEFIAPTTPTNVVATADIEDVIVTWTGSQPAIPEVDTYFVERANATLGVDDFESYAVGLNASETGNYEVVRDVLTGGGAGTLTCIVPNCVDEVQEVTNVNPIIGLQSYHLNFTEQRTGSGNTVTYSNIIKKDIPVSVDSFSFRLRSDDLFGEGGGAETVGGMSFYVIEWKFENGTTTSETGSNDSFGRRIQQFRGCGVGSVPTQDWTTNGGQYCHGEPADFLGPMSISYGDTVDSPKGKSCPFSCNDLPAPNTLGTVKLVSRNATSTGISILGASEFAKVVSWNLYIGGVATTSQSGVTVFPQIQTSYGVDIYIDTISFTNSGVPVDFLGDDFEIIGSTTAVSGEWQLREQNVVASHDPSFHAKIDFGTSVNNTFIMSTTGTLGLHDQISNGNGQGFIFKTFPKSFIEGKDLTIEYQSYGPASFANCVNCNNNLVVTDGNWEQNKSTVFGPIGDQSIVNLGKGTIGSVGPPVSLTPSAGIANATVLASAMNFTATLDDVTIYFITPDGSVATGGSQQVEIYRIILGNSTTGQTIWDFTNPITNYTAQQSPTAPAVANDNQDGDVESVSSGGLEFFRDTNVERNTSYQYQVFASNGIINTTSSDPAGVLTNDIPSQVQDLNGVRTILTAIDLDWTAVDDNSGQGDPSTGVNLTKYQIFKSENGGAFTLAGENLPQSPPITTFNETGLNQESSFVYQVSSCNNLGCSANSTSLLFGQPAAAPTGLTTTADLATVLLDWDEASDLEAYYQFNETSGNLIADSLGNIQNADSITVVEIDRTNGGIIGNGWDSLGIADATSITIGGNADDWTFLTTGSHTINIWMNNDPQIFNQITQIFRTSDDDGTEDNGVSLTGDWRTNVVRERLSYIIYENDVNIFQASSPFEYLIARDAQWHMYTMVIEEGVGTTFYRDGSATCPECGFVANTNTFDVQTAFSAPVFMNGGPDGGILEGTIVDEWSFWSGPLSNTTIAELYNSGSAIKINQNFTTEVTDYKIERALAESEEWQIIEMPDAQPSHGGTGNTNGYIVLFDTYNPNFCSPEFGCLTDAVGVSFYMNMSRTTNGGFVNPVSAHESEITQTGPNPIARNFNTDFGKDEFGNGFNEKSRPFVTATRTGLSQLIGDNYTSTGDNLLLALAGKQDSRGSLYMFKTFDKADLPNSGNYNVTWAAWRDDFTGTFKNHPPVHYNTNTVYTDSTLDQLTILIADGSYDRFNSTDFPNTLDTALPLKGGDLSGNTLLGGEYGIFGASDNNGAFLHTNTTSYDLTNSVLDQVTFFIKVSTQGRNGLLPNNVMEIQDFTIDGVGTWSFQRQAGTNATGHTGVDCETVITEPFTDCNAWDSVYTGSGVAGTGAVVDYFATGRTTAFQDNGTVNAPFTSQAEFETLVESILAEPQSLGATFIDGFNTDQGWLSNNTALTFVDTNAGHLRKTLPNLNNINNDITFDLRPLLGGDDWVSTELWSLRFAVQFDNVDEFAGGAGGERHIIGLTEFDSDVNSIVQGAGTPCGAGPPPNTSCAGDGVGLQIDGDIFQQNGKRSDQVFGYNACGTGSNFIDTGVTFGSQFWNTTDTYYMQMIRSASPNPNLNTFKVFSDAQFTNELFGISTSSGNCFGQDQLRYLRFGDGITTFSNNDQIWNIDYVQFFNDLNATEVTIDNIPTNFTDSSNLITNPTSTVDLGTNYDYRVIAKVGLLEGVPSNSSSVLTNDAPSQVPNVISNYVTPTDVLVDWDTPSFDGDGNPTTGMNIIKYQIFRQNVTAGETEFSFLTDVTDRTAQLQAYYTFTQTSGDLLVDDLSIIDDADSTSISNVDQSNSGRIGNGYQTLNAPDITIGGDANDWNFFGDSFTANLWVNSNTENGGFNSVIFDTTTFPTSTEGIRITYNSNNLPQLKLGFSLYDDGVLEASGSSGQDFIIKGDSTWHMYTIVWEEGVGSTFYRDSIEFVNTPNTNTITIDATNQPPKFFSGGTEDINGYNYDEWSFWAGALTTDDITQLYNTGSGLTITQPFIDTVGSDVVTEFTDVTDTFPDQLIYQVNACNEIVCGFNSTESQVVNNNPPANATGLNATAVDATVFLDWEDAPFALNYTVLRALSETFTAPDFVDTFDGTDDWVDNDSANIGVNTTNDNFDVDSKLDGTNDASVFDLQSILGGGNFANATSWALEFNLKFTNIVLATAGDFSVGLDSNDQTTNGIIGSADRIGANFQFQTGLERVRAFSSDDSSIVNDGSFNFTPVIDDDLCVRVIRENADDYSVELFDGLFCGVTSIGKIDAISAISSSVQDLRFIKVSNRDDTGTGSTIIGEIDNVKFFNGTDGSGAFGTIAEGIIPSQFVDSTVSTMVNYTYGVFARNNVTSAPTAFSNDVLTNTIPSPPLNLTVAMIVEDVFVDWIIIADNGTGEPSTGVPVLNYTVERKQGINPFGFLVNVTGEANTDHLDTSVISGANYTFRAQACNSVGCSPFSNSASIIATPTQIPQAPENLTATTLSSTEILLAWDEPPMGINDMPNSYTIQQRHVGFTGFITIVADTGNLDTTLGVAGLAQGQTYDFQVAGLNGAGQGPFSNIAQNVTFSVSSNPENLTATTNSDIQISLDWDEPNDTQGGILKYNIEQESPIGGGFSEIAEIISAGVESINGTWQYREMKTSGLNAAAFWFTTPSFINVDPLPASHHDALFFKTMPTAFLNNTNIYVEWSYSHDLSDTQNPQAGLHQSIRVLDGPNDAPEYRSINGTQFTSGVTGEGGPCGVALPVVNCYTADSNYPNTNTWNFNQTLFFQVPFGGLALKIDTMQNVIIPTNSTKSTLMFVGHDHATSLDMDKWRIHTINITDSTTDVTKAFWDFTDGNTQNCQFGFPCQGVVPNEAGEFEDDNFNSIIAQLGAPPATEFVVTPLTPRTEFNFRVNAENLFGTSGFSNEASNVTFGVPTEPLNLGFVTDGVSEITIDWDQPANDFGSAVTGYRIDRAEGLGGTFLTVINDTGNNIEPLEELFIGLLQQTTYIFRIAGYNSFGLGDFAANLTAGTFSGPTEPQNFFAVFNNTRPFSVFMSWLPPLNDGGKPIQGYLVERKDIGGSFQLLANLTSPLILNFTDQNLQNLGIHEYRVAAYSNPTGSFTSGQQVITFVAPNIVNFTINDSQVVGDIIRQDYSFELTTGFPNNALTQSDIIRNGTVDLIIVSSDPLTLDDIFNFTTYYILPFDGQTSAINTTITVSNFGGIGQSDVGITLAIPEFQTEALFFEHERTLDFAELNFNLTRKPIPWDVTCELTTGFFDAPDFRNATNVGFLTTTWDVNPSTNAYVSCFDPLDTRILSFTSFGSGEGTLALVSFTDQLGTFLGVPIPLIFILFFAAIWTGRSAATGIIFVATAIGMMGLLGYFPSIGGDPLITGGFWAMIVLITGIGLLIGKRFF